MLKLYLVLVLLGVLYNLAVSVEIKTKEKIYYKHTESTAVVEPESGLKDVSCYDIIYNFHLLSLLNRF
jgi:hypothetical protein